MKNIQNKKIAIIGGGPGGLTLARLLQLNGADVKVYERDASSDARPPGATLDLHEESGLAALAAAGLTDAFEANYRPGADKLSIMDHHGTIVWQDDADTNTERGRPEIDRGPLQKILLESLLPGTVVWDKQFVSMELRGENWQLHFKDGSTVNADLVIAADGANSKIRPYITSIKPFYSGYTAVEGAMYDAATNSPLINELLNGGKIFAMGDEKSLIVSSKGDGSLVFYPCFKADENWIRDCGIDFSNKGEVITWFKQEFASWADLWDELFENANPTFIPRPLNCMPLDQTWEAQPNLTILGDAAHQMPPYAGEGVNMAMLDALELSNCLNNDKYADIQSAIAAYEQQMRKRASEAARQSLESLFAMHSPQAMSFMLGIIR